MPKKEKGRDNWLSIPNCLGGWSNFQWRVLFCGIGYIMIVIAYAFSVPIPPLRPILHEYKERASPRSKVVISLIFLGILLILDIWFLASWKTGIGMFVFYYSVAFLLGYMVLSLFHTYGRDAESHTERAAGVGLSR